MINNTNTMPVISLSPWSTAMHEADSPSLLPERSTGKNFFDYASAAEDYDHVYPELHSQAGCALVPAVSEHVLVEDLVSVDGFPMEGMEDISEDSGVTLSVMEGFGAEEDSKYGSLGFNTSFSDAGVIPTTALELVASEPGAEDISTTSYLHSMTAPHFFFSASLPAPLGCESSSNSSRRHALRSLPGPHPLSSPTSSYPPSTPSTCSSDDLTTSCSSTSEVSTPGISGMTSGEHFVIPLPTDDKMAAATLEALETCSLTPLIKEELKYTIQSRRLAAGKPELIVDTAPPVRVKKVMTAEERERALKRREQNRMAAQRFRQKQKDTADVLIRKCLRMENSNTTLKTEIRRLTKESQELRQLLTSHLLICPKVKVVR